MKKFAVSTVLILSAWTSAPAQDPAWNRNLSNQWVEALTREFMLRQYEGFTQDGQEQARRAAQYSEQQFIRKANNFTRIWGAFIRDYNEKKAVNIRITREASKAFHDLERSDGWPGTSVRSDR